MTQDDKKTMIGIRIKRERRDVVLLFLIFLLFFLFLVLFGAVQFMMCKNRNSEITPRECFSNDPRSHDEN